MLIPPPKCPNCSHELSWQEVKGHFQCRVCGVQLKSNYYSLMFWTLGVLPFPFILFMAFGGIAVILGAGAVLFGLSVWIFGKFIDVRRS